MTTCCKKLATVLTIALAIVLIVTLLDIYSATQIWQPVGGWEGATYKSVEQPFLTLFWAFVYFMIFLCALTYYLVRKDKSEAIAITATSYILISSGLEDLLFYKLQNIPLENMTWFINTPMGFTSKYILGLDTVTPIGLIINIILFGIAGILLAKYLITKW